jgi:pimeloyl-ACP methyl ester carboxylesterase
MAKDVLAIVDYFGLGPVHIVGQALGGMIAQEFALDYPNRLQTLTLIYTSGNSNDETLPDPCDDFTNKFYVALLEYGENDSASQVKLELAISDVLNVASLDWEDLLFVAKRFYSEYEIGKGINHEAFTIQERAMNKSGSRYNSLSQLTMPTLIIHSENDPLVNIAHWEKSANLILNSKTVCAPGYGDHLSIGFPKIIIYELNEMIKENWSKQGI